jgi:chloride channel protein, CIC family
MFDSESLAQALRRVEVHGREGLPVLSANGRQVLGWITSQSVLHAVACEIGSSPRPAGRAQAVAGEARPDPESCPQEPPTPLPGYEVLEVAVEDKLPAAGKALGTITWPAACFPVSVLHDRNG